MSGILKVLTVKKPGVEGVGYEIVGGAEVPFFDPVPVGQSAIYNNTSWDTNADIEVIVYIHPNGFTQLEYWKIPGMTSTNVEQKIDEYFTISTIEPTPDGKGWITDTPDTPLPSWLPTVDDGYKFGFLPFGFNWSWLGKIGTWVAIILGLIVVDAFRKKK
jgi:hypothetical protein